MEKAQQGLKGLRQGVACGGPLLLILAGEVEFAELDVPVTEFMPDEVIEVV